MTTVNEGDMLLINNGNAVNVGYINGTINIPYLGTCFTVTVVAESGESRQIISRDIAVQYKKAYEEVLSENNSPSLIHGINNGYQDW